MVKMQNTAIKKADEEFTYLTGEAEQRRLAELREKYLHDIASLKAYAKKEGEKAGMKNQRIKIAKKMLQDKVDILLIEKYTGLNEQEILGLK